jgi:hypothetical protein
MARDTSKYPNAPKVTETFTVTFEDITFYHYKIEATDPENAIQLAREMQINGPDNYEDITTMGFSDYITVHNEDGEMVYDS